MFQSAPDPKAGREAGRGPGGRSASSVSIRSRPEGRERASADRRRPAGSRFNPLPTRRPGESRVARIVAWVDQFQSAPDPKAGREARHSGRRNLIECFNPLPTRRPGERPPIGGCPVRLEVSIRSRPEGRERARWRLATATGIVLFQSAPDPKAGREGPTRPPSRPGSGFNPLPTRRPGESREGAGVGRDGLVSIRSRPEGRERGNDAVTPRPGRRVSIRSRPEGRERAYVRASPKTSSGFQSAPDPKAGREASVTGIYSSEKIVSIRSRPEGRERGRCGAGDRLRPQCFNPLPTRRPGESRSRSTRAPQSAGFNPLPTRRPGESGSTPCGRPDHTFQSAPDPKAGREGSRAPARDPPECFNPLPTRRPGERTAALAG